MTITIAFVILLVQPILLYLFLKLVGMRAICDFVDALYYNDRYSPENEPKEYIDHIDDVQDEIEYLETKLESRDELIQKISDILKHSGEDGNINNIVIEIPQLIEQELRKY